MSAQAPPPLPRHSIWIVLKTRKAFALRWSHLIITTDLVPRIVLDIGNPAIWVQICQTADTKLIEISMIPIRKWLPATVY